MTSNEQNVNSFLERLKQSGIRLTHQRVEIFREVVGRPDHPDAASVYERVRKRVPTISLDTVYRTLWMLKDAGLITTLGPTHDRVRFDANVESHHHFVCSRCSKTIDFYCEEFNDLPVPGVLANIGIVEQSQVELRGICSQCAKHATANHL